MIKTLDYRAIEHEDYIYKNPSKVWISYGYWGSEAPMATAEVAVTVANNPELLGRYLAESGLVKLGTNVSTCIRMFDGSGRENVVKLSIVPIETIWGMFKYVEAELVSLAEPEATSFNSDVEDTRDYLQNVVLPTTLLVRFGYPRESCDQLRTMRLPTCIARCPLRCAQHLAERGYLASAVPGMAFMARIVDGTGEESIVRVTPEVTTTFNAERQ